MGSPMVASVAVEVTTCLILVDFSLYVCLII